MLWAEDVHDYGKVSRVTFKTTLAQDMFLALLQELPREAADEMKI
jgi:hypothetical protein